MFPKAPIMLIHFLSGEDGKGDDTCRRQVAMGQTAR
jgi:hypothetical protein